MTSLLAFFTHKFFRILLALYLGLFSLIWWFSSPVTKHFITPILAEQQLHLSDDASIRFNPFLMRLTLSDIKLSSTKATPQKLVFSLEKLVLQVELWQLAYKKLVLTELSLQQGMLQITLFDSYLVIAGIEIPYVAKEEEAKTAEQSAEGITEESAKDTASNAPYQLILPELLLSQFNIEIASNAGQQKNNSHHIEIEQLALRDIKATQAMQQGSLNLRAMIDKTRLKLSASALLQTGQGDINSEITIENYPIEKLAHFVEQLTQLKGSLSFSSQQKITFSKQEFNFRVQQAEVNVNDLLLGMAQQDVTLKHFQHVISNLDINLKGNIISHLAGNSSIKLTGAKVIQNKSKATIAAFEQLSVADIRFTLDDEPSIDITDIVLDNFLFSNKATLTDVAAQKAIKRIDKLSSVDGIEIAAEAIIKLPPVIKLKQLTLNTLHIHQQSITIKSIIFDTLTAAIIVKENKDIANLISFSEQSKSQETPDKSAVETLTVIEPAQEKKLAKVNETGFVFSLDELRFVNESALEFTDFSVAPLYQRTLFIDTFELGALSNHPDKQQEQTTYTLVGRSNKYANFRLSGYLQPFSTVTRYYVKGDFKEFSLPALSSYMKESTGLEVKTGRLNTDIEVTLIGEQLEGNIVILLEALATGLVDSEEAGSLIDQGALPLNMAMGILKDSDGNVELDVPLSGSISDPNFGLQSIITTITKKAIITATQEYLINTFVPYANIVSIALSAGEFALKLRFDDLVYQVEQVEPDEHQAAYLKDFIALMQAKENTRVTLCAISTPADIDVKAGVTITDKGQIKRLLKLGESREQALKEYLVEQGNIDSSRILLCKPQIDSDKGAIPRIAISV
ncbi:DUF748 domain-containing protein [Colwellia piezophila]|uniref:DUF748 domain-containing protein n=1 Tax=Colwellia piezophila TaxID=211668 RepID=UPI000368AFD3|nr:DUF748 domain-containing protein [Colwellia piezophila]